MPYSAGSDAQVPLRISSTDTTGREGSALHKSRSCRKQEPPSNVHRMKVRTRKSDKTSGKETRLHGKAAKYGQRNTLLQMLGLKTRQKLLRLPQCCASLLG